MSGTATASSSRETTSSQSPSTPNSARRSNSSSAAAALRERHAANMAKTLAKRDRVMQIQERENNKTTDRPRTASSSGRSGRTKTSSDPSRLWQPTVSSAARKKDTCDEAGTHHHAISGANSNQHLARGVITATPRLNHTSRAPATWCGKSYMK